MKLVRKVEHGPVLKTYIKFGEAKSAQLLGPQLGQRNILIGEFCKEFNEGTSDTTDGILLLTSTVVNPDKSYAFIHNKRPSSSFLLKAAGIKKGVMDACKEVASKVSLKHVYKIEK